MRILNVSAQKPDGTGSGVYLSEMVRCELAQGYEAAVVCGLATDDPTPSLPPATRLYDVRFDTPELPFHVCGMSDVMPYPATRYRDLTPGMVDAFERAFGRRVREALVDFAPDLIICHHLYLLTALVRSWAPDIPIGAISHSTDLRQLGQHNLERERILAGVGALDALFALHEEQARQIEWLFGVEAARVHVIGTGINDRLFSPTAHPPIEREAGRIAFAGKIWARKGVVSLLAALQRITADDLPADTPAIELVLAGGRGDDLAEHDAIRAQAASSSWPATLVGKLPQDQLAQEYLRSEVYVLPSFFEGLPLVVVEALACGCKVVTCDLPGIRPWLESRVPDAPVVWVEPPRMRGVDEPEPADLPAFERRLAAALVRALDLPDASCDVSAISWDAVTKAAVRTLHRSAPGPRRAILTDWQSDEALWS